MSLPESTDVGVIIGRFQVPMLHKGHLKLFETVLARHKRVLVLLGNSAWRGGIQNPLDYHTREQMIRGLFPNVLVSLITDRRTNEEWSQDVDKAIRSIFPFERITLYGGRKGFVSFYSGIFSTVETLEDPQFDAQSGTDLRSATAALPIDSIDFRSGVIYASRALPSGPVACVDGAVVRDGSSNGPEILLIRKPMEKNWRFPGGRLDIGDVSLDEAAVREVREETGVEVGKPIYITSEGSIPDWRATKSGLAIHSAIFYMPYIFGSAKGSDDAEVAKWFPLLEIGEDNMEACHKSFLSKVQAWYLKRKENNEQLSATN